MAIGTMNKATSAGSSPGPIFTDTVSFTGDSAYATGGTEIDAAFRALVGSSREVIAALPAGPCGGYSPRYDQATGKLLVFVAPASGGGALVEAAAAADLSAVTFTLAILSK